MKRNLTENAIAIFIILFLLSYVAYQAHRFFYKPVTTETLYEYTVSKSLQTKGIAIRDETALSERASGLEYYPLDDASRVALGETVVEVAAGGRGSGGSAKLSRELQEEIGRLQEAQGTAVDYSSTESFNRDIKSKLGQIAYMGGAGRYEGLQDLRNALTLTINKKQISNGKAVSYQARIDQLDAELVRVTRRSIDSAGQNITAPEPGYFSKNTDGYESRISTGKLEGMSLAELLELINQEPAQGGAQRVGKMVHSEKWVFAAAVPRYDLDWIQMGQQVQLQLDQIIRPVTATISNVVDDKKSETAVLLISCDNMNDELINLRQTGVIIHFQQFTGIRINSSDLRFQPNEEGILQRGVFVLDDHVVKFRLVEPIYSEESFLLSKTYFKDSPDYEHVKLYDQIITKGTDLHDGKTIQDY